MTLAMLLLATPGAAQDQDALTRWGDATLDKLEPFLPDASRWGFIPELPGRPSDFKAFANQGSHKYLALLVHKTWYFGDVKLFREIEEVRKAKAALRTETDATLEELGKTHRAELEAQQKAYSVEMDALTKQAQALFQQGKYEEGKAVIAKVKPFQDSGALALAESFSKREQELYDQENELLARRRSVSFRIYTNRTPSTTAFAYPTKAAGTLARRTLYRQDMRKVDAGPGHTESLVNYAIFLGPENFQNPHAALRDSQLKVKCIVVWAWIQSRADTVQSDEALVIKVLATMDYDGLAKLVEP
ncbi:MAG TPA: hypothetical protein VJN89_09685 [Candidatus Acidoferrum sp.]|nr:hypothetical protein [Candidatus Acidoferrum sp.]